MWAGNLQTSCQISTGGKIILTSKIAIFVFKNIKFEFWRLKLLDFKSIFLKINFPNFSSQIKVVNGKTEVDHSIFTNFYCMFWPMTTIEQNSPKNIFYRKIEDYVKPPFIFKPKLNKKRNLSPIHYWKRFKRWKKKKKIWLWIMNRKKNA